MPIEYNLELLDFIEKNHAKLKQNGDGYGVELFSKYEGFPGARGLAFFQKYVLDKPLIGITVLQERTISDISSNLDKLTIEIQSYVMKRGILLDAPEQSILIKAYHKFFISKLVLNEVELREIAEQKSITAGTLKDYLSSLSKLIENISQSLNQDSELDVVSARNAYFGTTNSRRTSRPTSEVGLTQNASSQEEKRKEKTSPKKLLATIKNTLTPKKANSLPTFNNRSEKIVASNFINQVSETKKPTSALSIIALDIVPSGSNFGETQQSIIVPNEASTQTAETPQQANISAVKPTPAKFTSTKPKNKGKQSNITIGTTHTPKQKLRSTSRSGGASDGSLDVIESSSRVSGKFQPVPRIKKTSIPSNRNSGPAAKPAPSGPGTVAAGSSSRPPSTRYSTSGHSRPVSTQSRSAKTDSSKRESKQFSPTKAAFGTTQHLKQVLNPTAAKVEESNLVSSNPMDTSTQRSLSRPAPKTSKPPINRPTSKPGNNETSMNAASYQLKFQKPPLPTQRPSISKARGPSHPGIPPRPNKPLPATPSRRGITNNK